MKSRLFTALASAVFMVVTGANALAASRDTHTSEAALNAAFQARQDVRSNATQTNTTQAGAVDAGADLVSVGGRQVTRASARDLRAATARPIPNKPQKSFTRDAEFLRSGMAPESGADAGMGPGVYIIQFNEASLAAYKGGIKGLDATSPMGKRGGRSVNKATGRSKLDLKSAASQSYLAYLNQKQSEHIAAISATTGASDVVYRYRNVLNGVAMRMTPTQAAKVRRMEGVRFVERDRADMPDTDIGPTFIGAPGIWDGSATGGVEAMGEGLMIGQLDTGINHENRSFAEVSEDGYVHINPFGDGVFVGECLDFAGLCNNKLVGSYSFLDAQPTGDDPLTPAGDPGSKDTDGHGSHTASTAAGNVLFDVLLHNFLGDESDFSFTQISGVAPRANIIAYKVCAPGCFASDRVAAVDQAITDGVDAINHSIGSAPGSPWAGSLANAFLDARAAGVMVHNSAGNSGPGAGTASVSGNAPWVTSVAASTHDREFLDKFLTDMAGGDAPPADITGKAITGGLTAAVVFAGDFPTANGSQNDATPEQCLEPFPAAHFPADTIVLCDRGAIARVQKGANVLAGGAAGMILANIQGGATSVVADAHTLPAIHVDADDGDVLRAWLDAGAGHVATITASEDPIRNAALGDILAGFSSRGPYNGFDFLAPSVSAPGVNIFAAGANLQFAHPGFPTPDPNDDPSVAGATGIISGTSMSSPHAAGASMLLRQVHPDWTSAEILSALMTTGKTTGVLKEDGATQADPFDYGGGRIQLEKAVNVGLVLDETAANFLAADPATGGDPSTLNVASMVNDECVLGCSWERTVRATRDGSWGVGSTNGIIEADVAIIDLLEGETATINVTADVVGLAPGVFVFDELVLTSSNGGVDQFIPVAIAPSLGSVPANIAILAGRNADSWLVEDLEAIEITEFTATVAGMNKAEQRDLALPTDTDNSSPFDDLDDGVFFDFFDIPAGASTFIAETFDSEAPDLDLFVGFDFNGDGLPGGDELLCVSATATADEFCRFDLNEGSGPLSFWVLVQNWQGTAPPPDDPVEDAFTLGVTVVDGVGVQSNMHVEGPVGALPELTPFDARVFWDEDDMVPGDFFYARVFYAADASGDPLADFGESLVRLDRRTDDVLLSASTDAAEVGDVVDIALTIQANETPEDRNYLISVPVPGGTSVVPGSISDGGVQFGNMILWDVTQPSLLKTEGVYIQSTDDDTRGDFNPLCDTGFGGFVDLATFGIGTSGFTGDDEAILAFAGEVYDFYGSDRAGGIFIDTNGYQSFDAANHSFFVSNPIPDPVLPNGMMANHYIDQIIEDDGVRGISLGLIGGVVSIIEYDGAENWTGDGSGNDRYTHETVIYNAVDPDFPEIIFAYGPQDYTDTGNGGAAVIIGVENDAGTGATSLGDDAPGNLIYDGLQVCYDFEGPSANPLIVGFRLVIGDGASGTDVTVHEADVVDSPGSGEATSSAIITVGMLNHVFSGFLHPIYEGAQYNRRSFVNTVFGLPFRFRIFDRVTGELISDGVHAWQVFDAAGELIADGEFEFNPWAADWRFRMFTTDVDLGFITVVALLDDGTEHSVSIEFIDGDRFGGGFPGF